MTQLSVTPETLTTASGAPVADNQNSVIVGPRGRVLLQDYWFLDTPHGSEADARERLEAARWNT
jgi:catalase